MSIDKTAICIMVAIGMAQCATRVPQVMELHELRPIAIRNYALEPPYTPPESRKDRRQKKRKR